MYQMWAVRPLNEANFSHLRDENNVNHTHPKPGYLFVPILYQPHVEAEAFCLDTGEAQTRTTQLRVFVFSETELPLLGVPGNPGALRVWRERAGSAEGSRPVPFSLQCAIEGA